MDWIEREKLLITFHMLMLCWHFLSLCNCAFFYTLVVSHTDACIFNRKRVLISFSLSLSLSPSALLSSMSNIKIIDCIRAALYFLMDKYYVVEMREKCWFFAQYIKKVTVEKWANATQTHFPALLSVAAAAVWDGVTLFTFLSIQLLIGFMIMFFLLPCTWLSTCFSRLVSTNGLRAYGLIELFIFKINWLWWCRQVEDDAAALDWKISSKLRDEKKKKTSGDFLDLLNAASRGSWNSNNFDIEKQTAMKRSVQDEEKQFALCYIKKIILAL